MKMKILYGLLFLGVFVAPSDRADDLHHRPRYTLRPGDVLELSYRYTPELNEIVTILPDGYVNLDLVGEVRVSDLTVEQAHDAILLKAKEKLNDPELNLSLQDFQQPYVVVSGEVAKPGSINIRENTTAMQAILMSGGFSEAAHTSQVLLFRQINTDSAEIHVLNLKKLHKTVDLERDAQLQSGDIVFVPRNKVEIVSRYIKLVNIGMYINPLQNLVY
jgi:polysaccharide export outer membrane protein